MMWSVTDFFMSEESITSHYLIVAFLQRLKNSSERNIPNSVMELLETQMTERDTK